MTLYLLNSPVLTDHGLWRFSPLDLEQARRMACEGIESAVGHEATARLMEDLLGVAVPVSRRRISMQPGDSAIVLRLLERLPEGKVLDAEALGHMPWELSLLERIQ